MYVHMIFYYIYDIICIYISSHRPYICEFSFICDFLKFTEKFAKNMAYN